MPLEFPYQIVTFLSKEPALNEPVYYGTEGWYPQLAIKRRFKLNTMTEDEFIKEVREFFEGIDLPIILTGQLIKPGRMPVRIIDVVNRDEMQAMHRRFLHVFGDKITSRYPNREGDDYFAHITAEYNNEFVIPVDEYTGKKFNPNNVWLLKDIADENALALAKIR